MTKAASKEADRSVLRRSGAAASAPNEPGKELRRARAPLARLAVRPLAVIGALLGIAGLLAVWQYASPILGPIRLPSPEVTLRTMIEDFRSSRVIAAQGGGEGGILAQLVVTVWKTLLGVAIGSVLGVAIGISLARTANLRLLIRPPLEALRVTPSLVAAPFLVLWFGVSPVAQIGLVAFFTFVTIQLSAYTAVRNLRPETLQFAATLGASRRHTLRTVILPGIMPELIGSLRVILMIGWGLELVAELIGAQRGIGRMMASAYQIFRTDIVIAGILWVSLVAVVFDWIGRLLLYRMTRWSEGG